MSAYRTVVVGTDGSDPALRAVPVVGSPAAATCRSDVDGLVVRTTD
jgi:hypothetical protein